MEQSTLPIIDHIPHFLDYCEIERGLSKSTLINYQRCLKRFVSWLDKSDKTDLLPQDLSPDDIWNYRVYLAKYENNRGETLKKVSQIYHLIALRALLNYFLDKDITSLPANKIKLPKNDEEEKAIKFLNLEQIERLLIAPDIKKISGLRDKAILESFFSTGLRIAELVELDREQFINLVDKQSLELGIIGKGGHPRTVYFSERALFWIKKYIEKRKDDGKALFIGNKISGNRLASRSIERIVKKYVILAKLPNFVSPHTLRHSFATDLLNKGADLRMIQELLGHKNISTTQIYTHVTSQKLKEVHEKYHSSSILKDSILT
jgi:site-specific recombinase XerD